MNLVFLLWVWPCHLCTGIRWRGSGCRLHHLLSIWSSAVQRLPQVRWSAHVSYTHDSEEITHPHFYLSLHCWFSSPGLKQRTETTCSASTTRSAPSLRSSSSLSWSWTTWTQMKTPMTGRSMFKGQTCWIWSWRTSWWGCLHSVFLCGPEFHYVGDKTQSVFIWFYLALSDFVPV